MLHKNIYTAVEHMNDEAINFHTMLKNTHRSATRISIVKPLQFKGTFEYIRCTRTKQINLSFQIHALFDTLRCSYDCCCKVVR